MTFPMPLAQTIGVCTYQAGAEDSHGNPVDSWAAAVPTKVYGYGPRSDGGGAEPGGTQVIVGLTVYAPPGFPITARDRVEIGPDTYEVEGEVGDWTTGPWAFRPGVTFALKRTAGGR